MTLQYGTYYIIKIKSWILWICNFAYKILKATFFLCLKIVKIDLGFKHTTCKFEKYFFSKFLGIAQKSIGIITLGIAIITKAPHIAHDLFTAPILLHIKLSLMQVVHYTMSPLNFLVLYPCSHENLRLQCWGDLYNHTILISL